MPEAYLSGVFPRSEELVEKTRALERGRVSHQELDATLERDIGALVELQRNGYLDSFVDGQLNWQDLFRPFSELFTGIQLGSLTRWFDNNTFYRKPVVADKIAYKGLGLATYFRGDLLPPDSNKKAILPGPFTFASLAHNSAYSSFNDLVNDLAHALKTTVANLEKLGYSHFQFNEPVLCASRTNAQGLEVAKRAFEVCAKGVAAKTILQTFFGSAAPFIDCLLDYPVDCIGLDFYALSIESLAGHDFNKELACGRVDGRNSLLETPRELTEFVAEVEERLEPRGVVLCPNCDLDFLPRTVAEKKLRVLAEAKAGVPE